MKIILVCLILVLLLVACVPSEESETTSSRTTSESIHDMKMVASIEDIEVWKLVDGLTVCYVTINHHSYEAAGIWCK